MTAELIVFLIVAVGAVGTALAMIFSRNPVYAVLLMVGNFSAVGIIFLILQATFLAAVQLVVYAGAIMVLFLFVVMLMGPRPAPLWEHLPGQRPLALLLGLLLVSGLVVAVNVPAVSGIPGTDTPEVEASVGNPQLIGQVLYERYALPFEITSIILLIAMIGAVTLAKRYRTEARDDMPAAATVGTDAYGEQAG